MELKWNKPTGNFIASQCTRYMVNKASGVYMAVRLGAKRGETWEGSEILLASADLGECKAVCEVDCEQLLQRD